MKLLITTQVVDKNDPILGFFHRWLKEFAKHFEEIHVICLKEGAHDLPEHVHVYSLGKENKISLVRYLVHFYRYVWQLRGAYDVVFSHMNPHYIVLAGLLWKMQGKKMFFWRNHAQINYMTYVAAWFSESVFYTSPFACTTRFKHSVQMPVGIDTNFFYERRDVVREPQTVLFLGRISTVKRPELFLEAVSEMSAIHASVYGDPGLEGERYLERIKLRAGENVTFHHAVPNDMTPAIYSAHEVYVNLTPAGSMDKTILEAAACGALILVANDSVRSYIPECMFLKEVTRESVQKGISALCSLSKEQKEMYRKELQRMVVERHSLEKLGKLLYAKFTA